MGYSSKYSGGPKIWPKNSLGSSFIIGVVEIINKKGYKKDESCNICVVSNEDDIILRYLFMYGH